MPGTRNYQAEYARRVAAGMSRGLSRSQARGHPGPGQPLASGAKQVARYDQRLEAAVKEIRRGKSLKAASESVGVSSERVRSYVTSQGVGQKVSGRWRIGTDERVRDLLLFSNGEARSVTVRGYEPSRRIGEFMAAVGRFLETNDPSPLDAFQGESVTDVKRRVHRFETDPNTLYRLAASESDDFARIYRIHV